MSKEPSSMPGAPWLRNILAAPAARYHDFRLLWASIFFNAIGSLGEQVVLGWLVLTLTNSPFLVGVTLALRMTPHFFIGLPGGALIDRVERRRFLRLLNLGMTVLASIMSVLILLHLIQLWHILLLTLAMGSLRAMFQMARSSFAYDIVGATHVVSGQSLSTLAMRVGGIGGSLLAGFVIGPWGTGAAYVFIAGGYLASTLLLLFVHSSGQAAPRERNPVLQNLKEYALELRRNRTLLMLLLVSCAAEVLGFSYQALLPSLARDVLKVGSEGLGVMNAFRSLGGMVGVILVTAMGEVRRKGVVLLTAIALFGGSVAVLGYVPNLALALVVLIVINCMAIVYDIMTVTLMQLSVPNELRGRAAGSWVLAIGTGPLGQIQLGFIASVLGATFALTASGGALVAVGLGALLLLPRLRKL